MAWRCRRRVFVPERPPLRDIRIAIALDLGCGSVFALLLLLVLPLPFVGFAAVTSTPRPTGTPTTTTSGSRSSRGVVIRESKTHPLIRSCMRLGGIIFGVEVDVAEEVWEHG
jgi:Na+-transporting methylmalonyl-CoA/oxaloacetate decarboxylase gamma subunit